MLPCRQLAPLCKVAPTGFHWSVRQQAVDATVASAVKANECAAERQAVRIWLQPAVMARPRLAVMRRACWRLIGGDPDSGYCMDCIDGGKLHHLMAGTQEVPFSDAEAATMLACAAMPPHLASPHLCPLWRCRFHFHLTSQHLAPQRMGRSRHTCQCEKGYKLTESLCLQMGERPGRQANLSGRLGQAPDPPRQSSLTCKASLLAAVIILPVLTQFILKQRR